MNKRTRRNYSKEFKEEAVKLVTEQGYSLSEAGRNLGINANMLGRWKREIDGPVNEHNHVSVQAELKGLRKENKQLTMEREILKNYSETYSLLPEKKLPGSSIICGTVERRGRPLFGDLLSR